jgi:TPR repeat protein
LGYMYHHGNNVVKDEEKAKQYYEKGAIGGCAYSRGNLGGMEAIDGSFDRAIKHWLIAASCGFSMSVNCVKTAMDIGLATEDHYYQALRVYEKYLEEVRSDAREC